jgi:hypothetical protein
MRIYISTPPYAFRGNFTFLTLQDNISYSFNGQWRLRDRSDITLMSQWSRNRRGYFSALVKFRNSSFYKGRSTTLPNSATRNPTFDVCETLSVSETVITHASDSANTLCLGVSVLTGGGNSACTKRTGH